MLCPIANGLWFTSNLPRWSAYGAALRDPGRAQREVLAIILRRNAASEFGRRHGFADLDNPDAFRRRVPLADRDALAADVERIRRGETGVLTVEPVRRLAPTSGSTAARRLVPCTRSLLDEFQLALGPWIVDMYRRRPRLLGGRAYWSVSPAIPDDAAADSKVPVGFDDDTEYLARWARPLVTATLAVPPGVRHVADPDAFRYITALHLLHARDLRLISVWHPTFLTLLLGAMAREWDRLVHDIRRGGAAACPGGAATQRALRDCPLPPRTRRADELARVGPGSPKAIWPELEAVSCWTHGFAARSVAPLRDAIGEVAILPKGLLATEAFVTIPFAERHPLAVRSHFFEFLDDDGHSRLAHELDTGGEYQVVVTTGGGLYRHPLGDRVRVDGFVDRTPSLTFMGRMDRVSDRRGEKLNEAFVAGELVHVFNSQALRPVFAMLAPWEPDGRCRYVLYMEGDCGDAHELLRRLDERLRRNPHYDLCRRLGQLDKVALFRISRDAEQTYLAHHAVRQRLGDIKPAALSNEDAWHTRFPGEFVTLSTDARNI